MKKRADPEKPAQLWLHIFGFDESAVVLLRTPVCNV